MKGPEEVARENIDAALDHAGWVVQDPGTVNLAAGRGIAVREFPLQRGFGFADYLLYVDGQAIGVVEAKKEGETLIGVEVQTEKYSVGLPAHVPAPFRPLPFIYQSTGIETRFTNCLDPDPRSRRVFHFHRPETLAAWIAPDTGYVSVLQEVERRAAESQASYSSHPTLRARLKGMPPIDETGLWPAQLQAIQNLEKSLYEGRPRALIQMATGSGKTFTAVSSIYRLIRYGGAQRVLFLVDRANLGIQAQKEFQQYTVPGDGRKFTELYNVQRLTSNRIDPVARVCITTVQRLYSMLQGDEDLDPALEEGSQFDSGGGLIREPAPVKYNPVIPIETFDFVFVDECHRSIYNLWRQVLEYFDAFLIGLTATPSKQTFGFFNQNLVMEYNHQQAVADGVNVDYLVYRIRTEITEHGSKVDAGLFVDRRDRQTRRVRWEQLDEDLVYSANQLDRDVVSRDQIRTVIRTFRDKITTEIFPGREVVPKTLIYAKDDSHADDIVQIVREEFGKGNDFAQKITYRTGTARIVNKKVGPEGTEIEEIVYRSTGLKPEDLLSSFRNSFNPRIVVSVDMIATGTDIKPLEIVMFMRSVKSRIYFEQMLGRGVRIIDPSDLESVTPDVKAKTHFVVVDCVGATEQELIDTQPLERQPTVPFDKLLQAVAFGSTDLDILSTLAARLARLDRQLGAPDRAALQETAKGLTLRDIASRLVEALDVDRQIEAARLSQGIDGDAEPSDQAVEAAAKKLLQEAVAPIATNPDLRRQLLEVRQRLDQTIDTLSQDKVLETAWSPEKLERDRSLVFSFEKFIQENKDEITALQVLYSRPYSRRPRRDEIKKLADAIELPPRSWTKEKLWKAYETLDSSRVRGSTREVLTDIVSLVRVALRQEEELIPYPDKIEPKYEEWLAQQKAIRRLSFTDEQLIWLRLIKEQIATNLEIELSDFDYVPFAQHGGAARAYQVFGGELSKLLDELNEVLVA